MTRLLTLLLACAIFIPGTTLLAQKDVSAEISAANDRFEAFFKNGDADGVASLYTEDARLLPPNHAVVEGRDNIRTFWEGFITAGVTAELNTTSALAKGKMAIEEGYGKVYANEELVDDVKYVLEWKKVNGQWLIHKDIWSSNNPPAGQ